MRKESMSRSLSVSLRCNAANGKLCGSLKDPHPPLQRRRFSKQSRGRAMAGTRAGRNREEGRGAESENLRFLNFYPFWERPVPFLPDFGIRGTSGFGLIILRNMISSGSVLVIMLRNMRTSGSLLVLLDKRTSGSILWRGWRIKWPPVWLGF
jgi:hypothetical protein